MASDGVRDAAAAEEAELVVEPAGEVETESVSGLLGEELLGLGEELEERVALDEALQRRDASRIGLYGLGPGSALLPPLGFALRWWLGVEGGGEGEGGRR